MSRTDVHAPSSISFDPEAYNCWGVFDTCSDPMKGGGSQQSRLDTVNRLIELGYHFGPGSSRQCGHCGAHLRYCALMVRDDVKQFIYVGETCLDGRFEMTKGEFQTLRKQGQLDREAHRLLTAYNEAVAANQALAFATYFGDISCGLSDDEHRFSGVAWGLATGQDILRKLRQYGSISERQVGLVEKIVTEQAAKFDAYLVKQAARAAEPTPVALTSGRQVIEGVVLSQKTVENDYGTSFKFLIKLDGGQRVYGSEPSSISEVTVGDRVRFTAKVEPKNGEPDFGYFSRPTKAEIVAQAVAA